MSWSTFRRRTLVSKSKDTLSDSNDLDKELDKWMSAVDEQLALSGSFSQANTNRLNRTLENRKDMLENRIEFWRKKTLQKFGRNMEAELTRLRDIVSVGPVSNYEIFEIHRRRLKEKKALCLHLAVCYMRLQALKNQKWREEVQLGKLKARPVRTAEHKNFFERAFSADYGSLSHKDYENYEYHPESDIFQNLRSFRTAECRFRKHLGPMFGETKPINVSAWLPPIELYLPEDE